MKAIQMRICSNQQVSDRYWHMKVDASELNADVQPGQFFQLRCGHDIHPLLRRPFSIYRINRMERTLEFLYLVKGAGTQRLTLMQAGEYVDVFGPLGTPFVLQDDWETILLLARGVGIATLAALAQDAAEKGVQAVAILSARSRNDLLAAETLQGFGAQVLHVTDEEQTSGVEQVRGLLDSLLQQNRIDAAFTCGSKRLSRLLQDVTRKHAIPAQIALEEHMGCAMGVCFACVCDVKEGDHLKTVRVCKEGPVFPLEKVVL
ncbi:dihydroorotate dehydrogenase electron transfer subunit [Brevibacillus choshinensis]|uniref:Dihydroorotate dehydrogenase electron transfer subunit n=1 Tax=Brevibacillus choshinensis TaxID=54911 RepID=A0ABX7FHT1_BRECH|nr:dihydroorotate dehydrogenase electron transfer subunit [Brevibacillus choshinensis]QRG65702.1 dihydroorotate dehydrogenase electron transfer subunit [Brevibacillus choshinensis]